MSEAPTVPAREDQSLNPPWTYTGSADRIFRLRQRASSPAAKAAATVLGVLLIIPAWAAVTCRYLVWAVWRGRQAELGATADEAALRAGRAPTVLPPHEDDERP